MGIWDSLNTLLSSRVQIGNALFTVLVKRGFYLVLGAPTPRLHCHPDFELHCIEQGSFRFRYDENTTMTYDGPGLLLIPPCAYHFLEYASPGARKYCFEFDLSSAGGQGISFGRYSRLLTGVKKPVYFASPLPDLEEVRASTRLDEELEYVLSSRLGELFLTLTKALERNAPEREQGSLRSSRADSERIKLLSELVPYIEQHSAGPLTLTQVAEAFHLSERQIERILREGMQEGFLSLLNRYRVRMAVLKLSAGPCNLTELAEECGFASYSSFWKHFMRLNGMSPSEFLRQEEEKHQAEGTPVGRAITQK